MSIPAIRRRLMTYIADADDKKVQGLYLLVEDDIKKDQTFELSDVHMDILDKERELHINNESKSYSWEEAKEIIRGNRHL